MNQTRTNFGLKSVRGRQKGTKSGGYQISLIFESGTLKNAILVITFQIASKSCYLHLAEAVETKSVFVAF